MEKFGIFDLLDALSAAMEQSGEEDAPPPAETVTPDAGDRAFAPPSYAGGEEANAALSSLLARHEEIKKKIKK